LGLAAFTETQRIISPFIQASEKFGYRLSASKTALAVGAPSSNVMKEMTLDGGTVTFDAGATHFIGYAKQTGTVYVYELLQSSLNSALTPKQMILTQHIDAPTVTTLDMFGESLALFDDILLVGSPLDNIQNRRASCRY
jgi:hypothetical protein